MDRLGQPGIINYAQPSQLTALTHLDGRNAEKLLRLRPYFSEFAWMKHRLQVMVAFLVALAGELGVKPKPGLDWQRLVALPDHLSLAQAKLIQKDETKIHHDLKAIESFLVRKLKDYSLSQLVPLVNLGIGSEDINSLALGLMLDESREAVLWPQLGDLAKALSHLAQTEKATLMVGRTHAQPAGPTTFGKEMANTLLRLCDEAEIFRKLSFTAKASGEVGTLSAYAVIGGRVNWLAFSDNFIKSWGLVPSHAATQVAPYDSLIRYLQSLFRLNGILLDFAKNMWLYLLLGYVKVVTVAEEVGSSGLPHKVNPIFFEGGEGGLEMANGIIETLSGKLLTNRLQRDFSDSTLRRNLVLPLAYSLLSWQSLVEGLKRTNVDRQAIKRDVKLHGEIWIEVIKTYGSVNGLAKMYDRLKRETRGKVIGQDNLFQIIGHLRLGQKQKQELTGLISRQGDNPYPERIVAEAVRRAKTIFKL